MFGNLAGVKYVIEPKNKQIVAARSNKVPSGHKNNPDMVALHNSSKVFVRKDDILKIFCDKPALYSVRLAELVYGVSTLRKSCMPGEFAHNRVPLDSDTLDSIISELIKVSMHDHVLTFSFLFFQLTSFKSSSNGTKLLRKDL